MSREPQARLYTIAELAEALRVTTRTVRRWIEGGDIAAYKFGRQWRFTQEDIDAFVQRRRRGAQFDVL